MTRWLLRERRSPLGEQLARRTRAQSEVVGVVLMTAVVVLFMTTFGVYYLGELDSDRGSARANVHTSVTTDHIVVAHGGGDALDADTTRVIVRVAGKPNVEIDNSIAALAARSNGSSSSDDGDFEPGERLTWSTSLTTDDEVELYVVDNATNTVLFDDVRNPTGGSAVFRTWAVSPPAAGSTGDEPPIDKPL